MLGRENRGCLQEGSKKGNETRVGRNTEREKVGRSQ